METVPSTMYKLCNLTYHQRVLLSAWFYLQVRLFSRWYTGCLREPFRAWRPPLADVNLQSCWVEFSPDENVLHVFQVVHATKLRNNVQVPGKYKLIYNVIITCHIIFISRICWGPALLLGVVFHASKGPTALPDSPANGTLSVGPPTRIKYFMCVYV